MISIVCLVACLIVCVLSIIAGHTFLKMLHEDTCFSDADFHEDDATSDLMAKNTNEDFAREPGSLKQFFY